MVPYGITRIETVNETDFPKDIRNGTGKNDIRVMTEIDVESLQKPETMPA